MESTDHDRPKARGARWVFATTAALLVGCGPTVFQGAVPIAVVGTPPPPPPAPPAEPARVEVTEKQIVIHEKVQFEQDRALIRPVSYGLLDEVVVVIKKHPEIKRIGVEGHASAEGDDDHNLRLSDRRANAVMKYLVDHGIAKGMLEARGHGETRPIADNDTDDGREKNRRVEFQILEQDKPATAAAGGTP